MQFRHDRRRRVLADDLAQADSARPGKEARLTPPQRAEVYAAEAHSDRQPRFIDFIPRRNLTFALHGLAGIFLVAGLQALFVYREQFALWMGDEAITSLDVTVPMSIARWISSMALAIASVVAMMLYSARRWRVDDYHRRYRVWLAAAAVTAVFSMQQTAPVLSLGHRLLEVSAQASNVQPQTLYGVTALTLLSLASVRMWFELRRSRSAFTLWCICAICFTASTISAVQWIRFDHPLYAAVFGSASHLLGVLALLFTFTLYERYVLLEIEGRLRQRAPRQSKRIKKADGESPKKAEEAEKPKPQAAVRTDLEPVAKQRPATVAKESPATTVAEKPKLQWDSTANSQDQYLSRAERKKLKRDARRQAA